MPYVLSVGDALGVSPSEAEVIGDRSAICADVD
jgi:hypothetical protein